MMCPRKEKDMDLDVQTDVDYKMEQVSHGM